MNKNINSKNINNIKRGCNAMNNGIIYCGDCFNILSHIPNSSIGLIYLDPPFFTKRNYGKGYNDDGSFDFSFNDNHWNSLNDYLKFISDKVIELHRILKDDGALYFHCDWHASHYIKVILDKVFGYENFRNEISVKRIKKNVSERDKVKKLNVGYDVILFYSKSHKHLINPPKRKENKPERWHSFEAPEYRKSMDYDLFGFKPKKGNHWRWSKERSIESIRKGILRPSPRTGKPEYFIPATSESLIDNYWDDITAYSFKFGYPTEKNEALLDRIIQMSSKENDIILDAFCGCGTAIASAIKLNRKFIGIDISLDACKLVNKRIGGNIEIIKKDDSFERKFEKIMASIR